VISKCRICGSSSISNGFVFQPYLDFKTNVYDCYECGCRFTNRDEDVYEKLHSVPSTYSSHRNLVSKAKGYFSKGDQEGLKAYLKSTPKNRFIIDAVDDLGKCEKVLEFGCSRGYLSSYSILLGKEFYGVDISETAIVDAVASFGKYFHTIDFVNELSPGYFDLIYHVGTIGCVNDPVTFISEQLKLLRPGGRLLFNAPNVDACLELGSDWLKGTMPPDLVTLFPSSFWENTFSELANTNVQINYDSPLLSYIRRKQGMDNNPHPKRALFENSGSTIKKSFFRRLAGLGVRKFGRYLPACGAFKPLPQEFGVFVTMTKL